MTISGTSHIDAMLRRGGVPVSLIHDGELQEANGIVDTQDEDLLSGEAARFAGKVIAVVVRTGVLVGLGEGSLLTVDGADYTVISAHQQDDGALSRVLCART